MTEIEKAFAVKEKLMLKLNDNRVANYVDYCNAMNNDDNRDFIMNYTEWTQEAAWDGVDIDEPNAELERRKHL